MTPSDKIITAVRQYCLDLFQSGLSTQQSIASGLLNGVEYFVGQQFEIIAELKSELKTVGQENLAIRTNGYSKSGHIKQIERERQKIIDFIDSLKLENVANIKLPFRRRLSESESKLVRHNLERHWNFDGGYWEPLTECSPQPFSFYPRESLNSSDYQKLIDTLFEITSDTIFEISEDRLDYETEVAGFDKDGCETIYTDKNNKWVVYISHEGTIAFGGLELLEKSDTLFADKLQFRNTW